MPHDDELDAARAAELAATDAVLREVGPAPTSWDAQDIGAAIDSGLKLQEPAYLATSDGWRLVYAGKMHVFIGESESGKTWAALLAAQDVLAQGRGVVFIDYEDDLVTFVGRCRDAGIPDDVLRDRSRVAYIRPVDPFSDEHRVRFIRAAMRTDAALVVLDGVTEAMTLENYNIDKANDVAQFHHRMAREWAATGAAVVLVDHVTKSNDSRGSYAIGSQHKRAGVDGATYIFEVKEPLARGRHGRVLVKIGKDRPGFVRQRAGDGKTVGMFHIVSDADGTVSMSIDPADVDSDEDASVEMRAQIAGELGMRGKISTNQLAQALKKKAGTLKPALAEMLASGSVMHEDGLRGADLWHLPTFPG